MKMKSYFPNLKPTEELRDKIFITTLKELNLEDTQIISFKKSLHSQPFIFGHVSGTGGGSPQRGVLVLGNSTFEENPLVIEETSWTLSQNTSNITLISKTVPYPKNIKKIVPVLSKYLEEIFPNTPISPATYALAVANWYKPGYNHTISGHTDDQPWYSSPPVFASVTTFPEGEPKDWRATYRFQVYDPGHKKYIDLYLGDESVCTMRADIMHRVLPPLNSVSNHKTRVNTTFRNLVSPYTDPLGYTLAMANHYRYYGFPSQIIIPKDVIIPKELIKRYYILNKKMKVCISKETKLERSNIKKKLRNDLKEIYKKIDQPINLKMMSKSNVVLESLIMAIKIYNME